MNTKLLLFAVVIVLTFIQPNCSAWTWIDPPAKPTNKNTQLNQVNEVMNAFRRKQFEKYSRPQMYSIMTRIGKRGLDEIQKQKFKTVSTQ